MTEEQWLACTDPLKLLKHLSLKTMRGRISRRKLILFSCACCRSIWDRLRDDESRSAVEVAERFADRLATKQELATARQAARNAREAGKVCNWSAYWCAAPNATTSRALKSIFDSPFQ